jgi:rare lipoprotein A
MSSIIPHRTVLFILLFGLLISPIFGFSESGQASWYGGKFHGRTTASGETFDTNALTAAHKTLPFGTVVEVTNLDNGKAVTVRINDRGPFVEGRIIDLSRAAAEKLDMVGTGVARVEIHLVENPGEALMAHREVPSEGTVILQIGSYGIQGNALAIQKRLTDADLSAELEEAAGGITRVIIADVAEAQLPEILQKLDLLGFSRPLIRRFR